MTNRLPSLFIIIHQDMVVAYGVSVEELLINFQLYLGDQVYKDDLNGILREQREKTGKIISFSFTIGNKQYYFQQLEKA